jgi:hypothetical protein
VSNVALIYGIWNTLIFHGRESYIPVVDEVISRAMAKYQTLMQNNPSQSNSWSSPSTVGGLGLLLRKMKVVGGGSEGATFVLD